MIEAGEAARGRDHAGFATLACFVAFFLANADQVFAVRVFGVNVRLANAVFGAGLVVWLVTRRSSAAREIAPLAFAWAPFAMLYATAALTSSTPALTLLKLGWFAFNLITVFAWCRLFDVRDIVRGYFAAFVLVSGLLVVDFASGFTRGPMYMLGFGQPNDLIPGQILYRPHAFYYEPSYAASSVATAWALALTSMARIAPVLSSVLVGIGLAAIVVTMSRVGWLYGVLAGIARICLARGKLATGLASSNRVFAALALTGAIFIALLATNSGGDRFDALVRTLGWQQTFERICPMMQSGLQAIDLNCLDATERRRAVGRERDVVPGSTSEGQRLIAAHEALSDIAANPWLGRGVTPGETRRIQPVTSNVWLEIASEGGIAALLAFLWGLAFTMHRWRAFDPAHRLIGVMILLYFGVAWQFLQTFPRLDSWIAFWVALTFTLAHADGRRRTDEPDTRAIDPLVR